MPKKVVNYADLSAKTADKAIRMFSKRGVKAVHMDDIAAELGISKRTLYEMFTDKEALLIAGIEREMMRNEETYENFEREISNPLAALLKLYRWKLDLLKDVSGQFFDDLGKYENIKALFNDKAMDRRNRTVCIFNKCADEGYFIKGMRYELIVEMMEYTEDGIMRNSLYNKYPYHVLAESFFLVHIRGLCTAKGLETLEQFCQDRPR